MAKKVDEVRYDVNNNWTEILDASGKVTSIDCTYEEFSGSVKKAVDLASTTTEIKSLEANTDVWIAKDAAVPGGDTSTVEEIYDTSDPDISSRINLNFSNKISLHTGDPNIVGDEISLVSLFIANQLLDSYHDFNTSVFHTSSWSFSNIINAYKELFGLDALPIEE